MRLAALRRRGGGPRARRRPTCPPCVPKFSDWLERSVVDRLRTLRGPRRELQRRDSASGGGDCGAFPGETIFAIARAEHEGKFDEYEPSLGKARSGNVLSAMEMLLAAVDSETGRIMSPLLGGARVSAKADLVHA